MSTAISVQWFDANKEPQCAPDPSYPHGKDLDVSFGAQRTCIAHLQYPAPRIGFHEVRCSCGVSIAITTAGRPDDPRTVKLACQMKQFEKPVEGRA